MYTPVRFFWLDCGDNSLAYTDRVTNPCYFDLMLQGTSRGVYEFDALANEVLEAHENIINPAVGFPTYLGAQEDCYVASGDEIWCDAVREYVPKPGLQSWVDFINGGVQIVCADSIDARGDVNLDNNSYQIADAVLLASYFVYGLDVFVVNQAGQIASTDMNQDGITLGVADLVYLMRIIFGDAIPYANLKTVSATVTYQANGQLVVDRPMGAAFVVAPGDVAPVLLAENMQMQYAFDGTSTRILVYSIEANEAFDGAFLSLPVAPNSVEVATYSGERVELEYGAGLDARPTDSPRNISGAL
jgi:hypothetical protein